jgi:ABC-type uncharacterized transport system auxiliary subunit
MNNTWARRLAWVASAGALLLGSCGGSLLQTKIAVPTVYMLRATGAATPGMAALDADLVVPRPAVRVGLDNSRIATLFADRRLDYFAAANWSGEVADLVQDLAVEVLRRRGAFRNVSNDQSRFDSGYRLEISVDDFQAEYAAASTPTIKVTLTARVGAVGSRTAIGNFSASAVQPATANRLNQIVAAYETAANAALDSIATDVVKALAKPAAEVPSQKVDSPLASINR